MKLLHTRWVARIHSLEPHRKIIRNLAILENNPVWVDPSESIPSFVSEQGLIEEWTTYTRRRWLRPARDFESPTPDRLIDFWGVFQTQIPMLHGQLQRFRSTGISSAMVERVFSMTKWRQGDLRSRLSVESLFTETSLQFNSN